MQKNLSKKIQISCYFLPVIVNTVYSSELPTVSTLLLETPISVKHIQQVLDGKVVTTDIVPVSKKELAHLIRFTFLVE